MTPHEFIAKWKNSDLKESAASQEQFLDLCRLLDEPTPAEADPKGECFAFEKGALKTGGGGGWADVWKRGCFAWEYKGKGKDLDAAFAQLQRYAIALENPPLLIVSDMERFRIHTNWTNTVQDVIEISLEELEDERRRRVLKWAFSEDDVNQLKPRKTRQELTEEVATGFAQLAQRLRDRGHTPRDVAHFVNRLVFCMFAEDVDLLPKSMFKRMLEASLHKPEMFEVHSQNLFAAMKSGGAVGFERVEWFNGGLFDDDRTLPLAEGDIRQTLEVAQLDWSNIDPSIMGTLFERGLDPDKRSQLGAHYTDRDKVMLIVDPVIVEPLTREWERVRETVAREMEKTRNLKKPSESKAFQRAQDLYRSFLERLRTFRILDPACGSGNFLYLSLLALKDLEHRTNLDAEALGLPREFPSVGPQCVKGIEINPFAAELARVSVWIGEIQWMKRNGFEATRNPILRSLGTIECRDALLNPDGTEAEWPDADVIVGNPPFLGGKSMKGTLGSDLTGRIRKVYSSRLPAFSDLVLYWFDKARIGIANGRVSRCGLVATKAIAKNANLPTLKRLSRDASIYNAWQNEPWVVEGAAVRVALVCFASKDQRDLPVQLNGQSVDWINPNLTTGLDTSEVKRLQENVGSVFIGIQKSGPLSVSSQIAEEWMTAPTNPNGRKNADVLTAYVSTEDLVGRPQQSFIIDFAPGLSEAEASAFERPFEYLKAAKYDPRKNGNCVSFPEYRLKTAAQNPAWWEPHRARRSLREALEKTETYVATGETTEHRVFRIFPSNVIPDKSLYAFPFAGIVGFGILESSVHEIWVTYFGNRIGAGNQRRYNASYVYLTFPFPEGLTPNIPPVEYANCPRANAIADAAANLNELRENWLNPQELVEHVSAVVPGYPDRIVPKDEKAAAILRRRTLTSLYNERPAWLDHAHSALDKAVAAAYGWPADLSDEEVLERLFNLNQERAAEPKEADARLA